jgi:hypothetical protein
MIVLPALEKITSEFTPERLDHRNKMYAKHYKTLIDRAGRNPLIYVHPIRAAATVLREYFSLSHGVRESEVAESRGFIGSVREEIILEG